MTQQILDPASEAEAEMAGAARACLVAALDHSKAESIKVTIEVNGGEAPVLILPPRALRFFADVLRQMAKREPMLLVPQKLELTTQEAIEANRLACRLVNRHRRIEFEELLRYQSAQKQRSEEALKKLSKLSQEMGEEL